METVGKRIRHVRGLYDLSQQQFTDLLNDGEPKPGLTRGAIGNWERDQGIKTENLLLISRKTGAKSDWLADGRGGPPVSVQELRRNLGRGIVDSYDPDAPEEEAPDDADSYNDAKRSDSRRLDPGEIPEREVRAGLGSGGRSSTVVVEGRTVDQVRAVWRMPVDFIRSELRAHEADLDIIPVDGDSMEPTLRSGDRVLVHKAVRSASPDGIFAIDDGIGTSVKRLQLVRGSDPVEVLIISDNPNHKEERILLSDLQIIGRVICKIVRL